MKRIKTDYSTAPEVWREADVSIRRVTIAVGYKYRFGVFIDGRKLPVYSKSIKTDAIVWARFLLRGGAGE